MLRHTPFAGYAFWWTPPAIENDLLPCIQDQRIENIIRMINDNVLLYGLDQKAISKTEMRATYQRPKNFMSPHFMKATNLCQKALSKTEIQELDLIFILNPPKESVVMTAFLSLRKAEQANTPRVWRK